MIRLILLLLLMVQSLNAVWLTHEQAMSNSPFKSASLGWAVHFPEEDAVLIVTPPAVEVSAMAAAPVP